MRFSWFHPLAPAMTPPRALFLALLITPLQVLAADLTLGPGGPALSEVLATAKDGDVINVLPGEYRGQTGVILHKRLTVRGVGKRPVFSGDGSTAEGKALWVVRGGDVRIETIEFRGARAEDGNGAALRVESGRVTVTNSVFIENQNAIVTANSEDIELTVESSELSQSPRESGLLHNCREYWERDAGHGIEPGFELAHQLFVSLGLAHAAALARRTSHPEQAARWQQAADELRAAAFGSGAWAMKDERGFLKRRRLDGTVQETTAARAGAMLPPGVPLAQPGDHFLNPDTSAVLPIVFRVAPPGSDEARRTIEQMDALWNQAWSDGGYGRYHVTSEPDSPGGWPFASLFVARAALEAGDVNRAWRVLRWLDAVPGAASGSWFEFYGPRVAPPFPQVGVIPWTWAELLFLLVFHVLGVNPDEERVRVRPRLLPGVVGMEATLPVRGHWLTLVVRAADRPDVESCQQDGRDISGRSADGSWLIDDRPHDTRVEIALCR